MNPFARHSRVTVAALVACLVLAACTASPAATEPSSRAAPPATPGPTAPPVEGNVDRTFPELSVEMSAGYLVSVTDPGARAWRVELRGTGDASHDWLEVFVEVGDVAPGAEARLYAGGHLVDTVEIGALVGADTAAAGGCHPTLDLCVSSGTIAIDPLAGRVTVLVQALSDEGVEIRGATADWPGEPFILGPWRVTESFPGS